MADLGHGLLQRPGESGGLQEGQHLGQPVVALGAPLGLASTVTSGIVSALDRYVPVPGDGVTHHLVGAIQTDAAINPGNSGGALVNCTGQLVGVNAAIATVPNAAGVSGGGSVGLGFAIPISRVLPIVEQLRNGEAPTHARLGVTVSDASSGGDLVTGASVEEVNPGSAADEAGLQKGDVAIPRKLAKPRFTTPYYRQFLS